ncbi:MAG: hypothetical protein JWO86_4763 [Myxococcaceae bacterium]|nr:hypothetical protein [Myxococcaceae bacterium]
MSGSTARGPERLNIADLSRFPSAGYFRSCSLVPFCSRRLARPRCARGRVSSPGAVAAPSTRHPPATSRRRARRRRTVTTTPRRRRPRASARTAANQPRPGRAGTTTRTRADSGAARCVLSSVVQTARAGCRVRRPTTATTASRAPARRLRAPLRRACRRGRASSCRSATCRRPRSRRWAPRGCPCPDRARTVSWRRDRPTAPWVCR